jgi:hypothetical protein
VLWIPPPPPLPPPFPSQRLFDNEFMTSVYTGSTQYVTALTLALLEDSGWYLPNYEVAQNSPFGLGAGCAFIEDSCIQDGEVPAWAEGTFCGSGSSIGCTPDKELVAYCNLSTWNNNLPSGYQYFDDPVSANLKLFHPRTDFFTRFAVHPLIVPNVSIRPSAEVFSRWISVRRTPPSLDWR